MLSVAPQGPMAHRLRATALWLRAEVFEGLPSSTLPGPDLAVTIRLSGCLFPFCGACYLVRLDWHPAGHLFGVTLKKIVPGFAVYYDFIPFPKASKILIVCLIEYAFYVLLLIFLGFLFYATTF